MTITLSLVLLLVTLLFVVFAAAGKIALWPAVFCLVIERLVTLLPPR